MKLSTRLLDETVHPVTIVLQTDRRAVQMKRWAVKL